MKKRPIYDALKKLDSYPFHMPGHKRNPEFIKEFCEFMYLDFTEIEETDNMHNPQDIIKHSMDLVSETFGTEHSYFLVNGSSCGILATILAHLKDGDYILVPRNCHISVYNGIMLSGAIPVYINPIIKNGIPCGIDLKILEIAINKSPNIKACIITSPTYEGLISDIESISQLLHKYGILLIVDEAHGASFKFSDKLPKTALECGADISIQSFHKTLPSLTQCAVLHTRGNLVNKPLLEKFLTVVQTTSPSYVFMLSIEYASSYMYNNRDKFESYLSNLLEIRKELKKLHKIKILDIDFLENTYTIDFDITRLTFFINSDKNGKQISDMLSEKGVKLEMYAENHIIGISTICDTTDGLEHFKNTLIEIDKNIKFVNLKESLENDNQIAISECNLRDIFHKKRILLPLECSIGRVCSEFIVPYPPGVPILMAGEIITSSIIAKIEIMIKNNIEILGIIDNKVFIFDS